MGTVVYLNQIDKSYAVGQNRLKVLHNISLDVHRGEFLSILGSSGSGKSTLMNIIGCMDVSDSGEYLLDGQTVTHCLENELSAVRNRKIGFVFQRYHLIPQYTVLQNVILPLLVAGMTKKEATERAEQTIKMVGLWDRITHKPNELSGGQQQRVAIARALINKPLLLLADEPTGALDSRTGKEILALFSELNEAGHTIIMITHDAALAKFSKRTVVLEDGCILM